MPANESFVARSRGLSRKTVQRLGQDLHEARLALGPSQAAVGRRARLSRSKVGRIERGELANVSLCDLTVVGAVLGLELSVRAYPVGAPLRDHVHAELLERFRALIHASLHWATEVPLPNPGDLRAWDALIRGANFRVGVEAETRVRDGQALERRIRAKQRDGGVDLVVLLLSRTRSNRAFVSSRSTSLDELFPANAAEVMRLLGAGTAPSGNAIVMI